MGRKVNLVRDQIKIIGTRLNPTTYGEVVHLVTEWARDGQSRSVFAANVHMLMEAYDSDDFQKIVNRADLVTPDGMPLVWVLRRMGYRYQERVYGPALTLCLIDAAARQGIAVGFYGGRPNVLHKLCMYVQEDHPNLRIAYSFSPPFRDLTGSEDAEIVSAINSSGIGILFVGLGCPKQEQWIDSHREKVKAVMVGVGAAFDIHAREKRQAPTWMQQHGLEWLFRLLLEPVRLWRRYLYNNPRFLILLLNDLWKHKKGSR